MVVALWESFPEAAILKCLIQAVVALSKSPLLALLLSLLAALLSKSLLPAVVQLSKSLAIMVTLLKKYLLMAALFLKSLLEALVALLLKSVLVAGVQLLKSLAPTRISNDEVAPLTIAEDETFGGQDDMDEDVSDGLETQGFIYEEPMESYWKDKNRLDDVGAFNNERWDQMACIHFIVPNMTNNGQAATPKTARVPHYQTALSKMQLEVEAFRAAGGKIDIKIYGPDQDYYNDFLHVVNSGVDSMAAIDWDALAQLIDKKEKGNKNRQHKFKDFGTTTGHCTTHIGSSVGVAKPSYKPGMKDSCIVDAMLALC
jgi:hypothetical protein